MNARTLRLIAAVYLVKTVLAGGAWLLVPDLPERVRSGVQAAWTRVVGAAPDRNEPLAGSAEVELASGPAAPALSR